MGGPGRTAVLAATAIALSGCALSAGGATDVTQTGARLEANARSGDTPAHFHFEYARREADFGTPAARSTPERGPVPPDTPRDFVARVGENVTGLSPGRGYVFRVCSRDGRVPQGICTDPSPERSASFFFTGPTSAQDSVEGSYSVVEQYELRHRGSVQAASGPSGADADGWLTDGDGRFSEYFEGRVTCLRVQPGQVTIGAVGTARVPYIDDPPRRATELVTIVQGPNGGRWNRISRESDTTPPDCSRGSAQGGFDFSGAPFTINDAP